MSPTSWPDGSGSHDLAFLGEDFVVLLDVFEVVEIVHHQPVRLRQTLLGQIRQHIELFQPRAVSEMEARDRIERVAVVATCAQEIGRGGMQQRLLQALRGAVPP